jgi:hypothetical protein
MGGRNDWLHSDHVASDSTDICHTGAVTRGAQEPHGLGGGGGTKILFVLFSLYAVLLTEGSILDPFYEIWEEKRGRRLSSGCGGGGGYRHQCRTNQNVKKKKKVHQHWSNSE